jgi:hypothetical protein
LSYKDLIEFGGIGVGVNIDVDSSRGAVNVEVYERVFR